MDESQHGQEKLPRSISEQTLSQAHSFDVRDGPPNFTTITGEAKNTRHSPLAPEMQFIKEPVPYAAMSTALWKRGSCKRGSLFRK